MTDSNCRPLRCKRSALPTELIAPKSNKYKYAINFCYMQELFIQIV